MKKAKKLKGISKETRKVFAESAVLVMLENMHDDIKFIAEGHSGLVKGIEDIKTDLSEFKEEMNEFKAEMNEFKDNTTKNFQTVFECLSQIDENLNQNNTRLDRIEKEIKELNRKIDQKADKVWVLEKIKILEQQLLLVRDKAEKEYNPSSRS